MTSHELARALLALPDVEALVDDGAGCLAEVTSARDIPSGGPDSSLRVVILTVDNEAEWPSAWKRSAPAVCELGSSDGPAQMVGGRELQRPALEGAAPTNPRECPHNYVRYPLCLLCGDDCTYSFTAGIPLHQRPPGVIDRRALVDTHRSPNWLFVEKLVDGTETVIDSGVAWTAGGAHPDYPPWVNKGAG